MEPYPYRLEWDLWQDAAKGFNEEPLPLVSIDWDFFYEIPSRGLFPDAIAEMMPGRVAIEEWFSKERSLAHWQDAYERIEAIGLHPEDYFSRVQANQLEDFAASILTRFRPTQLYLADSHAWGSWASILAAAEQTTDIVSFDAHHDCGYINYFPGDTEARSQARAKRRPSCDDWIHAALVHGVATSAKIVYPEFARSEWEMHEPTLPFKKWNLVQPTTYSSWQEESARGEPKEAIFLLVRSSAYSPPFFARDEDFLRLASLLSPEYACLDCLAPSALRIGDHDACRPRF